MTTAVVLVGMFLLLALGTPVAFSMLIAGALGLLMQGGPSIVLGILNTSAASAASSYELISVPMFMLMAEFVIISGVADQLFRAASTWVGRFPGGLGIATALAGAGFAAISGSSTASAATLSSTTVPAMLKQGYEPKLACGVVAISGTLAMLIPPSIALVLYGIVANVSIGKLLIAGVIPGIAVTFVIILTVLFLVWRDPSRAPSAGSFTLREKLATLPMVGPMILLFGLVTGLIYTGVATPTEAAALGAFGAMLLAMRSGHLDRVTLYRGLARAAQSTCMILMIILGAHVFGYYLTLAQVTQSLVAWVGALPIPPVGIIVLIILGLMVLGCLMDQAAIIILTVPVVLPVVKALGYDPVWFGVLLIVVAEVGLLTPPVGLNAFVVARYTRRPLMEVFGGVMPHVWAHLLFIACLVVFPQIALWLPSTMSR
jgi:C4-dicarboxylate transporter, DctM subunit